MSIASEITRLQGVKSDILTAIANKGVTVPADSMLDDCPGLIADIPSGPNYKVIGGKEYRTVVMPDGKEWLAENLDFKFCKLSGYGQPTTPNAWYYNNDESTYGWNGYKCGLLYNWYAVDFLNDNRADLCHGWHVPSYSEWDTLVTACGGAAVAGTKLKALDNSITSDWPNGWNGTDDYGLSLLPNGRYANDNFLYFNSDMYMWTSDSGVAVFVDTSSAFTSSTSVDARLAMSIRLVRDT